MDKDSENILRKRLEAELQAILNDEQSSKESRSVVKLDQTAIGRLSRMDSLQAQAMALASSRRRHNALKKIRAALQRCEDSEFGYCTNCGNPIAQARLEFDPSVATCIECAP
ncbi:MAG: TraR/DksA family transcriptional regulator [Albidovulum sp.]|nr:TraR/DksA family transcriptional regulator [Albidovulum sp.]